MSEGEFSWKQYLADFHRERAGVTEAVLSRALSGDHSPYRWLARAVSPDARIVLVHDAARAFTPPSVIRDVVRAVAEGAPAVVPVLPVADTVKQVDAADAVVATVDRSAASTVCHPAVRF